VVFSGSWLLAVESRRVLGMDAGSPGRWRVANSACCSSSTLSVSSDLTAPAGRHDQLGHSRDSPHARHVVKRSAYVAYACDCGWCRYPRGCFYAAASAYAARRKVAELQLSNSFDLAKRYLESARNYTQTVYLPLAASAYELYNEFLTFTAADPKDPHASAIAENRVIDECQSFISDSNMLFRSGAGRF
jgi:hypothetical protein